MAPPPARRPTGPFIYLSVLAGFGLLMMIVKPMWERAGYNSLRSECLVNLEVLAEGQTAWIKNNGRPLSCGPHPETSPGAGAHLWTDPPLCWTQLGFEAGLTLHGQYEIEASATNWTARCTIEVGGEAEVWRATDAQTAHRVEG